jgi:tetraacyldisaccharide 4'-kinase
VQVAMRNIFKKIEAIIWDNGVSSLFSLKFLFLLVSKVYGGAVKLRQDFYQKGFFKSKRLPCSVISIGNITVGGTGKTPMTIYVAQVVKQLGYRVAIISRGYKGKAEKVGGIVGDGHTLLMSCDSAGDEPYMMAKKLNNVPVIVGKDRFKAGMLAVKKFNTDVLVLDDAFQHMKLIRDIELMLLDYRCPFGNMYLLPRGPLREPIASLSRADGFILTRSEPSESVSWKTIGTIAGQRPMFRTFHVPYVRQIVKKNTSWYHNMFQDSFRNDLNSLIPPNVFAFSGLAKNQDFRRSFEVLKCNVVGFSGFPDHHRYSDQDLQKIIDSAKQSDADAIVTTEKDYVKIACRISWPMDLIVIGIKVGFEEEDIFVNFIKNKLEGLNEKQEVSGS